MQPALPWEELDAGDSVDAIDPRWLALRGLHDVEDECLRLQALITLARDAAASPSKFRRLARFLSCVREPVIVFSEFRDTLEACLPHIAAAGPAVMLHGGMDAGERGRVLNRFLGGGARVLLATDVAGEGLNLQGASRVVVTVEWPWTPQRLEQRVGRVDRLGQTRRVHAVHLTAQGSFEDSVVARVLARRGRADRDLAATTAAGEGPLASDGAEGDLAARIFGEQQAPRPAASTPLAPTSIEPDVALEAERIVFSRRLAAQAGLVDDAARCPLRDMQAIADAWPWPSRCPHAASTAGWNGRCRSPSP
jgi:superfamily II DNA or RNA helicase